jgi:hypothetical protein
MQRLAIFEKERKQVTIAAAEERCGPAVEAGIRLS